MVKNPSADAGHVGLIPGSGRSPGERNSSSLQYFHSVHGQRSMVDYSPWGCIE